MKNKTRRIETILALHSASGSRHPLVSRLLLDIYSTYPILKLVSDESDLLSHQWYKYNWEPNQLSY
jgi:hypothetical protein